MPYVKVLLRVRLALVLIQHGAFEKKNRTAQRALEEHDKRQIYSARERLREIQNIYAILADVIQKNISKASSIDRSDTCFSYVNWWIDPRAKGKPWGFLCIISGTFGWYYARRLGCKLQG